MARGVRLAACLLAACAAALAQRPAVSLNADLLLRGDGIYHLPDRGDIQRARIWLRPGFELSAGDWFRFGARGSFAKGTEPNRESILRFDNFHANDASVDRLYAAVERGGFEFRAGKFAMPLELSEMLWDHDIQPSGLSVEYGRGALALRGAVFHRSHIHHDRSTIAGGQIGVRHGFLVNWAGALDAGYLAFNALDQFQAGMARQNPARSVGGRLVYESAFHLAHARYRVEYHGWARRPVSFESTYAQNLGAPNQRRAVEALAQAGQLQQRGDWQVSYSFQRVERDAVVGAFNSDDWWYHSDFQGSRVTAAYAILPRVFVRFGAVFQRRFGVAGLVRRVQVDLGAQF